MSSAVNSVDRLGYMMKAIKQTIVCIVLKDKIILHV